MSSPAVEIRTITSDEAVDFRTAVRFGFATRDTVEDEGFAIATIDPIDRAQAAFEADRMVATLRSFPTELTVPGGTTVAAGGLSAVTCHPTHRRSGLLTEMIGRDLAASKEHGEVADILIAAEYPIYGRFGYGPAVMSLTWELDVAATRFAVAGTGTVGFVDDTTFRAEAPSVFERVRKSRPGMIARDDFNWDVRADIRRRPEEKPWLGMRIICRDEAGAAQGYANYKVEEHWEGMRPRGKVEVAELCAATPQAQARLWRFLAELDLIVTITAGDRPTDDTLPWLLHDARAAKCANLADFLWVRPLDVGPLLGARTYDSAGRLVLEVVDDRGFATGRFLLDASPDGPAARQRRSRPTSRCPSARLVRSASGACASPTFTMRDGWTRSVPVPSKQPTRCSPARSRRGATPGSDDARARSRTWVSRDRGAGVPVLRALALTLRRATRPSG